LIGHPEIVSATLTRKDESIACPRKARQRFDGSLYFAKEAIEERRVSTDADEE
jgi:hypothetical protein